MVFWSKRRKMWLRLICESTAVAATLPASSAATEAIPPVMLQTMAQQPFDADGTPEPDEPVYVVIPVASAVVTTQIIKPHSIAPEHRAKTPEVPKPALMRAPPEVAGLGIQYA